MIVVATGGRNYANAVHVGQALGRIDEDRRITRVVVGSRQGADRLARWWAINNDVDWAIYPADWRKHGRAAGPIRNAKMIAEEQPDLVVAFPGGAGTADCVRQARAAGIDVVEAATSVRYHRGHGPPPTPSSPRPRPPPNAPSHTPQRLGRRALHRGAHGSRGAQDRRRPRGGHRATAIGDARARKRELRESPGAGQGPAVSRPSERLEDRGQPRVSRVVAGAVGAVARYPRSSRARTHCAAV